MRDVEGVIERMGGQGHGVLSKDGERFYVPFTVPGDRIAAKVGEPRGDGFAAQLSVLEAPGPERVDAPCGHFQTCGGCSLQHWAETPYRAWKRDKLSAALTRRELADVPVGDLVAVPDRTRRRAEFITRRVKDKVLLGFHEAQSRKVVDLTECLVLRPELLALLPQLRSMMFPVLGDGWAVDLKVTWTETGADVLITGKLKMRVQERIELSKAAKATGLARLSLRFDERGDPELLYQGEAAPRVRFGNVPVTLAPGGFLQATAEAEQAMADLALDALQDAKRVADLFSGCGAFALRLAAVGKTVWAVDADRPAIAMLGAAAKTAGLSRLTATARDLERQPLSRAELKKLDAILLDPPRAGAKAQVQQIAEAAKLGEAPGLIVMLSCDPSSFSRDARGLVDAGYRLEKAVPIDQFRWSPHLEIFSIFRR
ncbi:MAG: methyltransferase [Ferrovibrio sp.]|uniref:class I SAM-dependent RNA methyltransferase n=1 Tax=Ferrovibrio sp. TaxID=1917215 RepID=UPI002632D10B|nr:RsmD family RNA methyltransferase [Ferrovibrio sp.]MCW0235855.1 methyltransferase [Ferrovibrio sp.]